MGYLWIKIMFIVNDRFIELRIKLFIVKCCLRQWCSKVKTIYIPSFFGHLLMKMKINTITNDNIIKVSLSLLFKLVNVNFVKSTKKGKATRKIVTKRVKKTEATCQIESRKMLIRSTKLKSIECFWSDATIFGVLELFVFWNRNQLKLLALLII